MKKSSNHKWPVRATMALLLMAGPAAAATAEMDRVRGIMAGVEADAKVGLEAMASQLKLTKLEKGETIAVWEERNEKFFTRFGRIGHIEFDSILKGKQGAEVTAAQEWANAMTLFFHDLQSLGEVVDWQRKVNLDVFQMDQDIIGAPERIDAYLARARTVGDDLTRIASAMKAGSLTADQGRAGLTEVKHARSRMENTASSIVSDIDFLNDGLTLKPEMDKKISKILENWKAFKTRHPAVQAELTDFPPTWLPLVQKHWTNYVAKREEYEKVFKPLLDGSLFKDIPYFKGLAYGSLAQPVIGLENDLKLYLMVATQKQKSEEALKKELAEDQRLTQLEVKRVAEIRKATSPEIARSLQLEHARAAGGATREREIQLLLSRLKEGSPEYEKLRNEAVLLHEMRHPEQLAVAKKIREFEELEARLSKERAEIQKTHEERRKRLGLTTDTMF